MNKLKLYGVISESRSRDMFEGFDESQLSEDYPLNFDLFQFKNIQSYAGKIRYASEYLGKPIGSGTSRTVYRIDNYKVLKLAKNRKGIAQNEVEIEWSGDGYYGDLLASIFDYDGENYLWVEMELALKPKKSDFKKLWGINFDELNTYLMIKEVENNGKKSYWHINSDVKNQMDNNEHVQHLLSFAIDTDHFGDIGRISSWGLVNRQEGQELVLIDFGITSDIYDSYYK